MATQVETFMKAPCDEGVYQGQINMQLKTCLSFHRLCS